VLVNLGGMELSIFSLFKRKNQGDGIVGERCVVTERIDNYAGCGQVKVKGQLWSARGVLDDDVFSEGETLKIVAIEGAKLICKK